jgi:hypothetical protein
VLPVNVLGTSDFSRLISLSESTTAQLDEVYSHVDINSANNTLQCDAFDFWAFITGHKSVYCPDEQGRWPVTTLWAR